MKAIAYHEYGSPDVMDLQEIDKPVSKDDEVLVRVRATSANPADWHFMRGLPYIMRPQAGLGKPKNSVLGRDVAGQVEAVGKDVTGFRPGDEVFANVEMGGFAEYARGRGGCDRRGCGGALRTRPRGGCRDRLSTRHRRCPTASRSTAPELEGGSGPSWLRSSTS